MGFILKEVVEENKIYVYCKLTDEGRRKISQGNFNPTTFSVGESEVDYSYYNENTIPLITDSLVLKPIDKQKRIKIPIKKNAADTDTKYDFDSLSAKTISYVREVEDIGFFSGTTNNPVAYNSKEYVRQGQIVIDISQLDSNNNKTLEIKKNTNYITDSNEPVIGDYLLVNWTNPYAGANDNFNNGVIDSTVLTPFLWYKIIEIDGLLSNNTLTVTVDRDLPNFGVGIDSKNSYGMIFPGFNSMEGFYNSIASSDYWESDVLNFNKACNTPPKNVNIWNLNILYTEDIAGIKLNNKQLKDQNSSKYAGFLNFITNKDFKHKNIGIIHYTNNNPSNKYGEKFVNSVFINIPTILWHKNVADKIGLQLESDNNEKTYKDVNFELKYFDLIDPHDNIVGIVFTDLKIITITDQELLYAMSYKSNRNWTLPKPNTQLTDDGCPVDVGDIGTYFYGKYEVSGGNVPIPTDNQINIGIGIGVNNINLNDSPINIPFNSGVNDFIWFAIPTAFPERTKWLVNVINKGLIGGDKIISGNLFPDPVEVTHINIVYNLYISNYRTNVQFIDVLL